MKTWEEVGQAYLQFFMNHMAINLDMLGPFMKYRVFSKMNNRFIVTKQQGQNWLRNIKIMEDSTTIGFHM